MIEICGDSGSCFVSFVSIENVYARATKVGFGPFGVKLWYLLTQNCKFKGCFQRESTKNMEQKVAFTSFFSFSGQLRTKRQLTLFLF